MGIDSDSSESLDWTEKPVLALETESPRDRTSENALILLNPHEKQRTHLAGSSHS